MATKAELAALETAIDKLRQIGAKVVLTVSPVPLSYTFTGKDCTVANEFSKSVLRVCAQRISQRMEVEYFPSYEIVRSGGVQNYEKDNIHVKDSIVREITQYMIRSFVQNVPSAAATSA